MNSDNYSQRLHDPHKKTKQHLLPDSLVDQFGIPTGQTRGKYKGQVEVPSTSLIYDHQEFTINTDNKLQCDWEGCNFSTPRRTALKRHIQCIHMDVRNYSAFIFFEKLKNARFLGRFFCYFGLFFNFFMTGTVTGLLKIIMNMMKAMVKKRMLVLVSCTKSKITTPKLSKLKNS